MKVWPPPPSNIAQNLDDIGLRGGPKCAGWRLAIGRSLFLEGSFVKLVKDFWGVEPLSLASRLDGGYDARTDGARVIIRRMRGRRF